MCGYSRRGDSVRGNCHIERQLTPGHGCFALDSQNDRDGWLGMTIQRRQARVVDCAIAPRRKLSSAAFCPDRARMHTVKRSNGRWQRYVQEALRRLQSIQEQQSRQLRLAAPHAQRACRFPARPMCPGDRRALAIRLDLPVSSWDSYQLYVRLGALQHSFPCHPVGQGG